MPKNKIFVNGKQKSILLNMDAVESVRSILPHQPETHIVRKIIEVGALCIQERMKEKPKYKKAVERGLMA